MGKVAEWCAVICTAHWILVWGWAGYVACSGRERSAYRVQVGKREGRRRLGRPRHRCDCTAKIFLQEENGSVWAGLIWRRIGTVGGPLRTVEWKVQFHGMRVIP
jgi:hypothetical protein